MVLSAKREEALSRSLKSRKDAAEGESELDIESVFSGDMPSVLLRTGDASRDGHCKKSSTGSAAKRWSILL